MDELEKLDIDSRFRLAILAAKRAKQLVHGAKKKYDMKAENPLTIAIKEIEEGLINFHVLDELEREKELTQEDLFGEEAETEEEEMTEEDLLQAISGVEDDENDEDTDDGDIDADVAADDDVDDVDIGDIDLDDDLDDAEPDAEEDEKE